MKQTAMLEPVRSAFLALQDSIVDALGEREPAASFVEDPWTREDGTGGGRTRVISGGSVLEKGGVNFSEVRGDALPAPATASRPHLANLPYHVLGVSLVIHPRNPYVPTSHMNVRFFTAGAGSEAETWWFGGGFDLTPYYPFREDAQHWHRMAKTACDPFGAELYPAFKATCDRYFYLPHRKETRGIGGLFFDDFTGEGFDHACGLTRSVGEHFLKAYLPILDRRKDLPYGERERDFQLYRRGRYAEFNLIYDRGTHFGLQSGGRTESILMSLPPLARWDYGWTPEPGSPEAVLYADYLHPRDWLTEE